MVAKPYELTAEDRLNINTITPIDLEFGTADALEMREDTYAHEAQKKLLEYLDSLVLYTADDEIGTGEDCNIMLCVTPKMWRDLLKDFGLEFNRKEV